MPENTLWLADVTFSEIRT